MIHFVNIVTPGNNPHHRSRVVASWHGIRRGIRKLPSAPPPCSFARRPSLCTGRGLHGTQTAAAASLESCLLQPSPHGKVALSASPQLNMTAHSAAEAAAAAAAHMHVPTLFDTHARSFNAHTLRFYVQCNLSRKYHQLPTLQKSND